MKSAQLSSLALLCTLSFVSCNKSNQADKAPPVSEIEDTAPVEQTIVPASHPKDMAPENMVWIPSTTYLRGSKTNSKQENGRIYPEESPQHKVTVKAFYIDKTEVTNAQFKRFVDQTGYVTFAERGLTKKDFPNAPAEMLKAGASIFTPPAFQVNPNRIPPNSWWRFTTGASWKHPQGPESNIENIMDHPVVCINYHDAEAYAKWAGKRLPSEAEWELAARGGLKAKNYVWGDERFSGKWLANCFQGSFPSKNTAEDGHLYTAPVKSYPANGYGLYDMAGNVWEMCSDYFHPQYYQEFKQAPVDNPQGTKTPISETEMMQWRRNGTVGKVAEGTHPLLLLRSTKGGSFLCHVSYCLRYRPAARHHAEPLTPTNHVGFRCVKDIEEK